MKYAWIAKHRARWPITLACDVLEVSTSGYFEHCRRKDTQNPSRPGANKRIGDEALLVHIKAIHAEVKGEYGWPRMFKELLARGIRVGKDRVRRLMQRQGQEEVCRHHRQQTRPADCAESAGTRLRARGAQPGVEQRHHLHRH